MPVGDEGMVESQHVDMLQGVRQFAAVDSPLSFELGQNMPIFLCQQVTANHCGQPCNEALTETAEYVLDECKPKGQETRPHASVSNLSQEVA